MKLLLISMVLVIVMTGALRAQSYNGMQADYRACTQGAGKIANDRIVRACTRLINNAAKKNELVGFFHALRASANTDRRQNCRDATIAGRLLKGAKLQKQVKRLATTNCHAASAAPRNRCLNANTDGEIAEGRLSIEHFQDAAGRPQTAYILILPVASCLASGAPDERVERSGKIHIFGSDDRVHLSIRQFVGKTVLVRGRPLPAHTVHHRAPILMEIREIGAR